MVMMSVTCEKLGGRRFRVTPAAAPGQPEMELLLNALSPRGPLPNLSSD